jgi:hypothetical protein
MHFSKSRFLDILILVAFALVIRAAYVIGNVSLYGTEQYSDFGYLHNLAGSLAAGKGFTLDGDRIYNQSIGYPALLAIFYSAFGFKVMVALWVNVILGAFSVALVYILSLALLQRHGDDASVASPALAGAARRVALVAAAAAAIYPDSLLYGAFVASENLLIPLMLGMLIAALWQAPRPLTGGALTGVLAAAAATVKAQVIFGCAFLPLVWVASKRQPVLRMLAATVAAIICLVPWTYINYRDSGGYLIPFTAVAGEVFLDGTNPLAKGKPTGVLGLGNDVEAGHNKIEIDRMKMRRAIGYIKERPAWYAKLLLLKFAYSLSPARDYLFEELGQMRLFTPALSRWVPTLFNALLFIGIAVGCFAMRERPVSLAVAASPLLGMFAVQLIFMAFPRYRFPFLFCLLPCAAFGWRTIIEAVRQRSHSPKRIVAVTSGGLTEP